MTKVVIAWYYILMERRSCAPKVVYIDFINKKILQDGEIPVRSDRPRAFRRVKEELFTTQKQPRNLGIVGALVAAGLVTGLTIYSANQDKRPYDINSFSANNIPYSELKSGD